MALTRTGSRPGSYQVDLGTPPRRRIAERRVDVAIVHEVDGREALLRQRLLGVAFPDRHELFADRGRGADCSSTVSTTLKMAVAAPAPRPSVAIATAANDGRTPQLTEGEPHVARRGPSVPADGVVHVRAATRARGCATRGTVASGDSARAPPRRRQRLGLGSTRAAAPRDRCPRDARRARRSCAAAGRGPGGARVPKHERLPVVRGLFMGLREPRFVHAYFTPATWRARRRSGSSRRAARRAPRDRRR